MGEKIKPFGRHVITVIEENWYKPVLGKRYDVIMVKYNDTEIGCFSGLENVYEAIEGVLGEKLSEIPLVYYMGISSSNWQKRYDAFVREITAQYSKTVQIGSCPVYDADIGSIEEAIKEIEPEGHIYHDCQKILSKRPGFHPFKKYTIEILRSDKRPEYITAKRALQIVKNSKKIIISAKLAQELKLTKTYVLMNEARMQLFRQNSAVQNIAGFFMLY